VGRYSHGLPLWLGTSGGYALVSASRPFYGSGWGSETTKAESVPGTNAPYIQLLVCQKD